MKRKIISIISVLLVISALYVIFTSNNSSDVENTVHTVSEQNADVIMPTKVSRPGCEKTDNCYVPSLITVTKGSSVTWKNEDSAFHSVTSGFYDEPNDLFDSGYLDPYQTFSFVFDESGTYDYYCTLHPWMEGQVIVN